MIHYFNTYIFPAAFALLPGVMDSPEARAMVLSVGLQESGFIYRKQIGGPAKSLFQFEKTGVHGVIVHDATAKHIIHVCEELCYLPAETRCYDAIEHNDILATCFARLLLYTLPDLLARRTEPERGYALYLKSWRPGKPRHEAWAANWAQAWTLVAT